MDKISDIASLIGKSVFFLGAGFSRKAGCLTSAQMFHDLKNRILDEQNTDFSSVQKETLKFLISCLQYHSEWRTMEAANSFYFTPNIEELALLIRRVKNRENFLPYPITGNWADKLVKLESEYLNENSNKQLFDSLELKLKKLLKEEWLPIKEKEDLSYLNPLKNFLSSHSDEEFRINIFSLNNDTVIEEFFNIEGEVPWRGFSNGKWSDVAPDTENDRDARINLYKLHGSVDWVRLADMDTWELDKLESLSSGEDEGTESDLIDNIDEKHNPYIIFGQGTKSFSIEPFFSLIHHFYQTLTSESTRYVFVIGYSFFDPYINNLLFSAIKDSKKLIIVNPSFAPNDIFETQSSDGWEIPKANDGDFHRVIYKDGYNVGSLTDFLRDIQKNGFYSELPEFNYLSMSAENVEYIPLRSEDFLDKYFSNNGEMFKKFIQEFEDQHDNGKPF